MDEQALQELFEWLSQYSIDKWPDKLKEIAEKARMDGLVEAIEMYWQEQSNQLAEEDFADAQEESTKAEFGEDYVC